MPLTENIPDQLNVGPWAAIDLGSNSFHMVIARLSAGELKPIDILSEKVQLGAGIDENGHLTPEAQQRALSCLERFAQRVTELPRSAIRIVGTNALREAKNRSEFITAASHIFDIPVEVIAGREEARLIYLGVAHTLADDGSSRLVVDIGGGSTEIIIGSRFEPQKLESLHMGCVSFMRDYFVDGLITEDNMKAAETAAARELLAIRKDYRRLGWESAIGSSGTVKAIRQACQTLGLGERITAKGLKAVRKHLINCGTTEQIDIDGIKPERQLVLPSGVAILCAIFDSFDIDEMSYSDGALREGVLYDMAGRLRHEDVRERTVQAMLKRYHVDTRQARRVEATARILLSQVEERWNLNVSVYQDMLSWAALTHEMGLIIAHTQFHKHSAYLIHNSDMPGFTHLEQQLLAFLVRGHRRKFPKDDFKALPDAYQTPYRFLCLLLRLAVILHRSRSSAKLPTLKLNVSGHTMDLEFPKGWLHQHPLTEADLNQEIHYLNNIGFKLSIR